MTISDVSPMKSDKWTTRKTEEQYQKKQYINKQKVYENI